MSKERYDGLSRVGLGGLPSMLSTEANLTLQDLAVAEQHAARKGIPLVEALALLGMAQESLAYPVHACAVKTVEGEGQRSSDPAVIERCNHIIGRAVEDGASDVHIATGGQVLAVRSRICGVIEPLLTRSASVSVATGPTGSGKTTALYASLAHLCKGRTNSVSVEGPVELVPNVTQIPVSTRAGNTFAEDGPGVDQRVLELGADDYVVKPFDPAVFQSRVMAVFRRLATAAAILLVLPTLAAAQKPDDITGASLSDLMGIEVERVFGASERVQPVTEAPSAVSIVTADEIRRYGYRSLAEILQGVRGFYVTNDRNYSYVGVRGFAKAGDYNTRVLLLLNGQRINDNVFDQAPIGADLNLDVAIIDRVEIIRGPASSLYGTSAFFAVINVITKSGGDLNGTTVTAGGGHLGARGVRAVTGRQLASGLSYFVGGSFQAAEGMRRLYFPEYDADGIDGVARDLDSERAASVYGQLMFGSWTLSGGSGSRHKDVPTAAFGTTFNAQDPRLETDDVRSFVTAQFERSFGPTRVSLTGAFNNYSYGGMYPYGSAGQIEDPTEEGADGSRLTFGARASRALPGGHTVSAGAEFVSNMAQDQWVEASIPENSWQRDRTSRDAAVFAQDEVAIRRWLRVSAGLRFDAKGRIHRLTPRAAVIVGHSATEVVKYLYGRAFRAPNAYEMYYWSDRSPDLTPETIDTHELVWERYTGEWLRTSVAAYQYAADDLIALRAIDANNDQDLEFVNEGRTTARGFEAEAEVRLKYGLQAFASYAMQRSRDEHEQAISNSPRHLLTGRASFGATTTGRFASLEFLHVGRRLTLTSGMLPAVSLVNATASVPLRWNLSMVATARNLLSERYADPASDEHAMDSIQQNGRTVQLELRWSVGK